MLSDIDKFPVNFVVLPVKSTADALDLIMWSNVASHLRHEYVTTLSAFGFKNKRLLAVVLECP